MKAALKILRELGLVKIHEISPFKMHGSMALRVIGPDGKTKEVVRKDNLIVDVGFDFICDAMGLSSGRPGVLSHIGVGEGATAPAAGDTALQTQLMRKAAAYAHTAGTKIFTIEVTFNAGEATGAITEAGVFNASTSGVMLDRVTFAVVNKGAADAMVVTFTFTLS